MKKNTFPTKIMGIINATDDSFFSSSRFQGDDAIAKIYTMIENGASIIDIGAVSSRPGSLSVSEEEEFIRIQPICDMIKKEKLYLQTDFSIDSYTPKIIEYALKSGFSIVNDITGLKDDNVAKITAQYNATIVIMHMQKQPKDMQKNPQYSNVIKDIDDFFTKQIKKAKNFGISKIILDVGIGFGKTLEHNLQLLKNMNTFKHFGYEILIGASRKSLINDIDPSEIEERLSGTLAIHLHSIQEGASIIRCHDVKEHHQAIKVQKAILEITD